MKAVLTAGLQGGIALALTAEGRRLDEDAGRLKNWKRWGPYLSERQWATVREDYSPDNNCWESFPYRALTFSRLPLGRGRTAWHNRPRVPSVLRAGAVERQGPAPQGAIVRPDEPGRQPLRGRQRGVLLPRRHPLVPHTSRHSTNIRTLNSPTRRFAKKTGAAAGGNRSTN